MARPQLPDNPETDLYRARFEKDRRSRRTFSVLRILAGGYLLYSMLFHSYVSSWSDPHVLLASGGWIVFSLALVVLGALELISACMPVPPSVIENLRRRDRSQLFRQAQGVLPWRFRKPTRTVEAVVGALLLLLAAGALVFSGEQGGAVFGYVVLLLIGVGLLGDALLLKPWQAKRLIAASAEELANRLTVGELTTGSPSSADTPR